jgi:hypothetical protein
VFILPGPFTFLSAGGSEYYLASTDGSETGIADFLGNVTAITSPSQSYFLPYICQLWPIVL